ncbi:hypothetical protein C2828_05375 [Pasteurella multocida]|nr:hypothetical protein [Pasteurella multocida]NNI61634.1 hypothetical protein [Pasteurella multocida]NNI76845.1 hypothetical protein [Pasteurella multocida]
MRVNKTSEYDSLLALTFVQNRMSCKKNGGNQVAFSKSIKRMKCVDYWHELMLCQVNPLNTNQPKTYILLFFHALNANILIHVFT